MKETVNKIRKKASLKRRYKNPLIEPDEIFLDSQNLPEFDTQQFEGQIERPIKRSALFGVGIVFLLIVLVFGGKLWSLQIAHSATYKKESANNSLDSEPIFAARGNIYDRNGVELAWNGTATADEPWGARTYINVGGFAHVLGYVSYPQKDNSGNYWQTTITGRDGVEEEYNAELNGTNGSTIVERDIAGNVQGGNMVDAPVAGKNLTLSIDSRLQAELYKMVAAGVTSEGFKGGTGIIMDVHTGQIIALTNYPEYDSNVLSNDTDPALIHDYFTSASTPLLDRAIGGLYTPGSDVKPYLGLEALQEGVIGEYDKIKSIYALVIPNPYHPDQPSVFRDYHPDNGYVDMRHALEVSSNIYFMEIAGGYQSQKGIGITGIEKAWTRFGISEKTGIDLPGEKAGTIPSPAWKAAHFNGAAWLLGDTYNTAIGQYGVQVAPIEMLRAISGIATRGTLVTPHVLEDVPTQSTQITDIDDHNFTVIQEGMRLAAIDGTTPDVTPVPFDIATKSGTAQVGVNGQNINAWMTSFFPYEQPEYAMVIMLENGPAPAISTAHHITRSFLGWVGQNAPEYGEIGGKFISNDSISVQMSSD